MGSQQVKYRQTPQTCCTLRTVGCDWSGRGDCNIFKYIFKISKTLLHSKKFNFFISKLHKRLFIAQNQSCQSSEINRFRVAQIGEVIFSLRSLLFLSSSVKVKRSLCAHSLVTLIPAKRWSEAPWSSSQFPLDMQTTLTLTHFTVVHNTMPFLTGTRTHASGSPGRDVNHWTTITLVLTFALTLYWSSHPIPVIFFRNRLFYSPGTPNQNLFQSSIHVILRQLIRAQQTCKFQSSSNRSSVMSFSALLECSP